MAIEKQIKVINATAPFGAIYLVTYIGAAIHFVEQSQGFAGFVLALLKASVWPAFLVHKMFDLLNI